MKTYVVSFDNRPDRRINASWMEIRSNGDLLFTDNRSSGNIVGMVPGGTYLEVVVENVSPEQFLQE